MTIGTRASLVFFLASLTVSNGCGNNDSLASRLKPPTTSTPPTSAPLPTPASTLQSVSMTGTLALTSIGQTSQLTASASYSDQTSKDVTADGNWSTGDSRVATVAAGGLVTVAGFGITTVSVRYLNKGAGGQITATPAGTFALWGRVREPGLSGLPNVSVRDMSSARVATTNSDGAFSFGGLMTSTPRLRAERDGYEPYEAIADRSLYADLPLQRVIRIVPGETVKPPPLAPNDLEYTIGSRECFPCRRIRVMMPAPGVVEFRVSWQLPSLRLTLIADGIAYPSTSTTLLASVPFASAGEAIVYLGMVDSTVGFQQHADFTITTILQ
jgi:hypothetical protein